MNDQPSQEDSYCQDSFDTAKLREFITRAFNDDDFSAFCFDYFQDTYERFASGTTRSMKIHYLIEDCYRQDRLEQLLSLLSKHKPHYKWHKSVVHKRNTSNRLSGSQKMETVDILVSDINLNSLHRRSARGFNYSIQGSIGQCVKSIC